MKLKKILLFIPVCALTAACAGSKPAAAPELLEPEGITYDTARVARSDVAVVRQYNAYVKSYSEPLYFTKSNLQIKSVDVMLGDRVAAGDVIATLDTEPLDGLIAEQRELIADLGKQHGYANATKDYDIKIASAELDGLRKSGADDAALEQKLFQLEKLELELAQLYEAQALELNRQRAVLDGLTAQLDGTVLTAPFDGAIVQLAELYPGGTAAPYAPVAYIADSTRLFVKYAGTDYFSVTGVESIVGRIEDRNYELEYIPLPTDEYLQYVLAGNVPPATFDFAAIDGNVKTGQYVSIVTTSGFAGDVLTVPINSIYAGEADEGSYVYVMENNQKVLRAVELGLRNSSVAEVRSGLSEGDEVFVKQ